MKPGKIVFVAVIIITALIIGLILQQQSQEKLRAENDSLAQQVAQLKADGENLSNLVVQAKSSQALPKEQFNELLKLRGEVGVLHRQVAELGRVKPQIQPMTSPVSAGQNQAAALSAEDQFKLTEFHTVNALKQLGLAMRIYADNNNQFATNFDQLKNELGGVTNFAGNISLDSLEFVNAGRVSDAMPEMIIFRERTPRRFPSDGSAGGGWQRVYGLADGSVQTIYSQTENFDEFEKPRLVPPPNQ